MSECRCGSGLVPGGLGICVCVAPPVLNGHRPGSVYLGPKVHTGVTGMPIVRSTSVGGMLAHVPVTVPILGQAEYDKLKADGRIMPKPALPTDYAARKALPLWTYLTEYFPDAFVEVVKVAVAGDKQHANEGKKIRWAREKSTDQMNTAFRHMFDYSRGTEIDTDGCHHLAKAIWRLSAELQLSIERKS